MAGTHGGNSTCNFSRLASADLDEVKLRICDLLLLKQVESSIDEVGCSVVTGMAGQGRRAGCVGAVFYLALAPTLVGAIVGGAGTTRIADLRPAGNLYHQHRPQHHKLSNRLAGGGETPSVLRTNSWDTICRVSSHWFLGPEVTNEHATLLDWIVYFAALVRDQVCAVLPVCTFLALFQVVVLRQSISNALETVLGLGLVIVGLGFFTFGLLNGLMPMGERLGKKLPEVMSPNAVIGLACLLGVAVTLAEPALGVVKTAGSLIKREQAPHLYALLFERTELLVLAVAAGVGMSASAGMLRIRLKSNLKKPVLALTGFTLALSSFVHWFTDHSDVLGLAWDLGAVTTGPVTVPLVIALGMGVAGAEANASPLTGFGVVTLASLIPVNLVMLLSLLLPPLRAAMHSSGAASGGEGSEVSLLASSWREETTLATAAGLRALVPLVAFMSLLLQRVLKDTRPLTASVELRNDKKATVGASSALVVAQVGIILFNIGLSKGLTQLGTVVGATLPAAFAAIPGVKGSPLMVRRTGIAVAFVFAWALGFASTLAEPALFTLAVTVEKLTQGSMSKQQVVYSVALGVGTGTALGLMKVIMQWPLMPMLLTGYALAALLTVPAQELLVNVAWDSAGVTTGPVTVPLVISLGLGVGKGIGAADGFGILSLASVCPIVSVLAVGLFMRKQAKWKQRRLNKKKAAEEAQAIAQDLANAHALAH